MRSSLVTWQLEQIEGECALLQGHATDPSCPCESETEHCVRKRLLTIEALAKEAYPMLDDQSEKQVMTDLADQARTWRKEIEQLTIGSSSPDNHTLDSHTPDNPGKEPIRVETAPGGEVRIYKEQGEFHEGSLRTIKPDEKTLILVGCPVDQGRWADSECVCRATGDRGCMELHSITKSN